MPLLNPHVAVHTDYRNEHYHYIYIFLFDKRSPHLWLEIILVLKQYYIVIINLIAKCLVYCSIDLNI